MNRYEKIMQEMTIEKMAEIRTRFVDQASGFGDPLDYHYENDAGIFEDDRKEAIRAEIAWLKGGE